MRKEVPEESISVAKVVVDASLLGGNSVRVSGIQISGGAAGMTCTGTMPNCGWAPWPSGYVAFSAHSLALLTVL